MKYLKIKLEDNKNILVDEFAEIKDGNWYFDGIDLIHQKTKHNDSLVDYNKCDKKVIATINHSISLDVPMVIVENKVEKLAKNHGNVYINQREKELGYLSFCEGYKAAQQQKGVYSEDALLSILDKFTEKFSIQRGIQILKYDKLEFIQSLKQEYIELEIESGYVDGSVGDDRIKTNRNSIGQLIAYIKQ